MSRKAIIFGAVAAAAVMLAVLVLLNEAKKTEPSTDISQDQNQACIQVITPARYLVTGEVRDFPTPCDVPGGWIPIKAEVSQETSTWQIHRNEEYRFEFKYPTLGKMMRITDSKRFPGEGLDIHIDRWSEKRGEYSTCFRMFITLNPEHFDLEAWFSKNIDLDDSLKKNNNYEYKRLSNGMEILTLNNLRLPPGYPGYLESVGPIDVAYITMSPFRDYIVFFSRGQNYDLQDLGYDTNEKIRELENQILSTFRFIEPQASTVSNKCAEDKKLIEEVRSDATCAKGEEFRCIDGWGFTIYYDKNLAKNIEIPPSKLFTSDSLKVAEVLKDATIGRDHHSGCSCKNPISYVILDDGKLKETTCENFYKFIENYNSSCQGCIETWEGGCC